MKKLLQITVILLIGSLTVKAQNKSSISQKQQELERRKQNLFDEKTIAEDAKAKGMPVSDIKGYVAYKKREFIAKKNATKHSHNHDQDVLRKTIYLNGNHKTTTAGCDNMGFESFNFNNWQGSNGTIANGNPLAVYTSTFTGITSPDGNNVFMDNVNNYHTIMSIPTAPGGNFYPNTNQNGWDSIACRIVGTQTVSDIPFVSPYSFDGVSARLNGTNPNKKACELKYVVTTSSSVKRLSFSYAIVFQAGISGHSLMTGPYFTVKVKNENTGIELPGCTSYTFDPYSSDTSLIQSDIDFEAKYRKWKNYSVDLSSLPANTPVSVTFFVTGCSVGGHWGYAYVDAECGGIGNVYGNKCSGSAFATLVAPTGFIQYQWIDPSNNPISGATNDTLIVNPGNDGDIYTVQLTSPGGCILTQTVAIGVTQVNIINLNTTSSCLGGNSGTAFVQANGSNGIYTYTWTNSSTGAVVGNSQTATGLAPGQYHVEVASTACGQTSGDVTVGVAPPSFYSLSKSFCGNLAFIDKTGGSNYQWYTGSGTSATSIAAPIGTNDSLWVSNPVNGDIYTLVYKDVQGCMDSIRYTLIQVPGGNTFASDIINVCPGGSNGSAVINLSTSSVANYTYTVFNTSSLITNTITAASTLTVMPLSQGSYSFTVNDGQCIYANNTFTINDIQTTFTASTNDTVLCFPQTATVNLQFGASTPPSCGLDAMPCAGSSAIQLFSTGTFTQNGSTSYPTPYGNWYTYGRNQYLIRKSDLNAAGIFGGKISSIAFNVLNIPSGAATDYPDFQIKMGCTSLSALPDASSSDQNWVGGLFNVYSSPSQSVALGWNTYNFGQSYLWDGVSNIVIETCFTFPDPSGFGNYTDNLKVQLKQMPYIANMYHVEDTNPVCSGGQLADNGNGSFMSSTTGELMLPNMRFNYCSYSLPASNYTVEVVSGNGNITQSFNNDSIVIAPTFTTPSVPNVPTIYTIKVTNPEGLCTATKTVAVLYPSSQLTVTANSSTNTICEGSQVQLSATGAVNYLWSYGSSTISTAQTLTVTPPVTGNNNYVVVGSSNCAGNIPDTRTVTINVLPKANLAITPISDVIKCLNTSITLTANVTTTTTGNPGTPYTYNWTTLPGNLSALGTNTASVYTTTSNTTNTFVITVNGNCAIADKDTIVVANFQDNLSVSIIDSASVCGKTNFTLNANVIGGRPVYNYNWTMLSSNVGNSNPLNTTAPEAPGIYSVSVVITDSCNYTSSDIQLITVLPPCDITIPNIITPNGDGANDMFKITNIEYHSNSVLTIFDRWGRKVYENSNYQNDWRADNLNDGTYFYILDVQDDKKYNGYISIFSGK